MASYLDRYRAGECERVWSELATLGAAVRTEPLLSDAIAVARETMARARRNVELLIPRLEAIGYQFGFYEEEKPVPGFEAPLVPPAANMLEHLDALEKLTGPLPLSLRAWYEIVGSVNFMGYHSEWPADYPDPLVVDSLELDYRTDEYSQWCEQHGETKEEAEVGPFEYDFAPDYYHKADVSGGPAYSIALPSSSADAEVLNEPHHTTFVDYLRICFRWGGFPGLKPRIGGVDSTQHIAYLTEGLLPL